MTWPCLFTSKRLCAPESVWGSDMFWILVWSAKKAVGICHMAWVSGKKLNIIHTQIRGGVQWPKYTRVTDHALHRFLQLLVSYTMTLWVRTPDSGDKQQSGKCVKTSPQLLCGPWWPVAMGADCGNINIPSDMRHIIATPHQWPGGEWQNIIGCKKCPVLLQKCTYK